MSVKLLNKLHLVILSYKMEAAQARLSLHLSKCHIVGNHMSRLNFIKIVCTIKKVIPTLNEEKQNASHLGY